MAKLTRRGFMRQASVSAASAGVLATVPSLGITHAAASESALELSAHDGPLAAHVRNVATGEIAIYVGTRQIIIHDREIVARLIKAIR